MHRVPSTILKGRTHSHTHRCSYSTSTSVTKRYASVRVAAVNTGTALSATVWKWLVRAM